VHFVNIRCLIFGVVIVCLFGLPAYGQPWLGSGTEGDPYQIWDACDMQAIGADANFWDAHFRLMADIDLAGYTGTSFNIIGTWDEPFTGVFDGNGHTISNFTYTITYATGEYCKGLFGEVDSATAEIKDLGLVGHKIIGNWRSYYVGSLVGKLENGTVTSCYAEGGNISGGDIIGGLVGRNVNGLIYNCYATGRVTTYGGDWGVGDGGGLVATNSGTISNCYAKVKISGRNCGAIGGLVGFNYNGYISNCYATGSVNSDAVNSSEVAGGLVGINYNRGTISNCYATGRVSRGRFYTGGLVGFSNGTVNASFWDIQTSWQSNSAGGIGKTTEKMQTKNTFIGASWDFTTPIWTICEGQDYPRLWWENAAPAACVVGGDRLVEADANCEARVVLDGLCSSDEDSTEGTNDDTVSFDWYEIIDPCDANSDILLGSSEIIECNLSLGEHDIMLEVTDKACAFDTNEVTITVEDVTPPEFSLSVEPNVLWPVNHKMVEIRPSWEVSDNCDEWPDVSLVSITMNEDAETKGSGRTIGDIWVDGNDGIWLRAERSGKGTGRVYTITYQAVDDSNNVTVDSANVIVPHDRR